MPPYAVLKQQEGCCSVWPFQTIGRFLQAQRAPCAWPYRSAGASWHRACGGASSGVCKSRRAGGRDAARPAAAVDGRVKLGCADRHAAQRRRLGAVATRPVARAARPPCDDTSRCITLPLTSPGHHVVTRSSARADSSSRSIRVASSATRVVSVVRGARARSRARAAGLPVPRPFSCLHSPYSFHDISRAYSPQTAPACRATDNRAIPASVQHSILPRGSVRNRRLWLE